jgi:hypothetical protein
LTIASGGQIDVNEKGYQGTSNSGSSGYGPGAGDLMAGGGYGGVGGWAGSYYPNNYGGVAYGSVTEPTDLGSSGGSSNNAYSGRGGGAMKISVSGTMNLEGNILARGGAGYGGGYGGGSAGGSVWITTENLTGSGLISVNGGNGDDELRSGSGSGGRIALYYTDKSGYTGSVTAYGGTVGSAQAQRGSAGTIYLKGNTQTHGDLIIDNNGVSGANTEAAENTTFDNITIQNGGNYTVTETHTITLNASSMATTSDASLTIESGGTFQAPNLTSISDFQIVNNSTFSLPAILSPSNSNFTMTNNGVYNHTSPTLTIPSGVTWYENGTESTIGDTQPITDIVVEGTLEFQNQNTDLTPASFESITINNGGVLTHQANSTTQTVALNLNLGELTINEGGAIDVSGKGYKGGTGRQGNGYGPGGGLGIQNYAGGGAGHGGGGGSGGNSSYGGAGGDSYGSVSSPLTIGSGGGNGNYGNGGSGGGAIKLIVNGGVSIEGEILADGGDGGPGNDSGGGGAGGSIWMSATEITGIGYMSAGGGDGATAGDDGGGGGGGRISLTYASSTLSFSSLALTGGTGFENGEDGTIYIFAPPDPVTNIEPTVSNAQIDLTWVAPTNPYTPAVTDYYVYYKQVKASGWTRIEPDPETSETTASISGLTNGTGYDVKVIAINDAGQSDPAILSNIIPYAPPEAPTNVEAQVNDDGLGNVTVELTFDPPADDGGGVEEYLIYIGDTDGATPWYNSSWSHRSKLTIPAENINEELTNFPVYVNLNDLGEDFFQHTQNNGGDIRVTTDDGITEVPRELVSCDIDNQTGELHFLAPSLSATDNTDFFIYYGNASGSDYPDDNPNGAEAVWINNFAFVSHDGGGTGSTSSGINGIPQGGVIAGDSEGRIGDATYFDGSDDGIALGTDLMVVEDFTVSLFTKSTEPFSTTYRPHYFGAGNYFYLITETTGKPKIYRHSSDGWLYAEETTGTQAYNDWVFLSGTYDGSSLKIYENGLHVGSEMATGNLSTPSTDLYVGYAYSGAANQWMHGVIDEVRISNTARSQGWISAEYTNQNTPTDFYTITGYIASTPSSPAILTGLTLGETYTFTAKSKNGGGISDFSQPSNEVTLDYEPDAPNGLNVTDAIDSSIDLEWTAPDNVVLPDNLDYHIFYRETGSADWIRIEPDPETSETTASITGLTNGTAYDVAVQAVNDAGKSAYATLDGNIPYSPPSEPRNLQAQVNDDGLGNVTVELTFDPPADDGGGVEEYFIYIGDTDGATPWYNSSWSHRSKLTIPAENINEELTNFPVYVKLNDLGEDFFQHTQNNGGDIRVTTDDGITEVPRELVSCDIDNQTGELHFLAPSLSATDNSDFFIYYGNASGSDYQDDNPNGAEAVWDDNFVLVSHDGGKTDRTHYGNDGTEQGGVLAGEVPGALGDATEFDGVNDYFTFVDNTSLDVLGGITISSWVKVAQEGGIYYPLIAMRGSPSGSTPLDWQYTWVNRSSDPDYKQMRLNWGGYSVRTKSSSTDIPNDTWQHTAVSFNNAEASFFLVGDPDGVSADATSLTNLATTFLIGSDNQSSFFKGGIDEVRISSVARSAYWIAAEYANQSTPNTFYAISIGAELVASGPSSPITISGLTLGETYTFIATAVNAGGESSPSLPSNEVTIDWLPNAVTDLQATVLDSQIDLTWTAPTNTHLPVPDYIIEFKESSLTEWIRIDPDPVTSNTTESIAGLTNGIAYDVRVAAKNSTGTGDYTVLTDIIPYAPPSEPLNIVAEVNADASVNLTFNPPADDGGGVDEYKIFAKTQSETDYTLKTTTTELFGSIPAEELILGEKYTFTAKASNGAGESDFSAPSNEVTIDFLPDPVTNLDATPSDSQIDPTWTAPTNTHLPVPDYIIEFKESYLTEWIQIDPDPVSSNTNESITDLTNGIAYDVRVAAKNDAGKSDYSSLTNITPIGASLPPTGLTFTLLGGGEIQLSWYEPSNSGGVPLTDYIIKFKEEFDQDFTIYEDGISTDTSATISGLDNDQNYFFYVIALNSEGESLPSEEIPVRLGEPGSISALGMEDTVYPEVIGIFEIENLGSQNYDYQYTWSITESATNTCGGGDDIAGAYDGVITLEAGAIYEGYPLSTIDPLELEGLPGYEDFEENGMTLFFHVQIEYGFEISSDYYEWLFSNYRVIYTKFNFAKVS